MLVKFEAGSPQALDAVARKIVEQFPDKRIFALQGDLGSGKTTFVKAFCRQLGIQEAVSSPTFSIVQEYGPSPLVYHFDLYRLKKTEELMDIGFEDYLERNAYVLVEWPELALPLLPLHFMLLRCEVEEGQKRNIFCQEVIND